MIGQPIGIHGIGSIRDYLTNSGNTENIPVWNFNRHIDGKVISDTTLIGQIQKPTVLVGKS